MKKINLNPKQAKFLQAFRSKNFRYLMFGGGMGGAKTYLGAILFVGLCFDYPKSRFAVVRKNLSTLRRTTIPSFRKFLNDYKIPYRENKADFTFLFANGSEILFVEADRTKDPDFNKLKGLELSGAMIDEANEVEEEAFSLLKARIGRWNSNGCPAFIYLTCNPAKNWVKDTFYDPWENGTLEPPYFFQQALVQDNLFLPQSYIDGLQDLPGSEYKRYVLGDWNFSNDPNQLILYEWIAPNLIGMPEKKATALGIDVADAGADKTVFAYNFENNITYFEEFQQDTDTTADVIERRMQEQRIGAERVSIDIIGVGVGTYNKLRNKGYPVNGFISGGSPTECVDDNQNFVFANLRAQYYWNFREGLRKGEYKILNDRELIRQLTNMRYIDKDKKFLIESKDQIKKRLGYSPDKADAAMMSYYTPLSKPQMSVTFF